MCFCMYIRKGLRGTYHTGNLWNVGWEVCRQQSPFTGYSSVWLEFFKKCMLIFYRLYFLEQFQFHSKTEQKVQRYPPYPFHPPHTHTRAHTHSHTRTRTHTRAHAHTHAHAHARTRVHAHTRAHTHTCTCTRTHTCSHTQPPPLLTSRTRVVHVLQSVDLC